MKAKLAFLSFAKNDLAKLVFLNFVKNVLHDNTNVITKRYMFAETDPNLGMKHYTAVLRSSQVFKFWKYQEKWMEWKKLDAVLPIVKSLWNGTIMITRDSNNDLLASTAIQKWYIELLDTYDLNNNIIKATCIGKKLRSYHFQNSSKQNSSFRCITVSGNQWW